MDRNLQSGQVGVQPFGLGKRFRHTAQLLVVVGVGLLATGIFAQAALAAGVQEPTLTATRATFHIKAGNPATRVWQLSLWEMGSPQKLVGEVSGTSGILVVDVPSTSSCFFQVDVNRNSVFYSGFRRTVAFCGGVSVSSSSTSPPTTSPATSSPSSTSPPTSFSTPTSKPGIVGKTKPSTSGGSGGSSTTTGDAGSGGTGSTPTPPSKLAFTGAGFALWMMALFGALLLLTGALLLLYARRYPRTA
jgi:hypothetical protein